MNSTFVTRTMVAATVCVLVGALLSGCSQAPAPQVPAGMKVGAPLTQAQSEAIVQKRMAGWQKSGN